MRATFQLLLLSSPPQPPKFKNTGCNKWDSLIFYVVSYFTYHRMEVRGQNTYFYTLDDIKWCLFTNKSWKNNWIFSSNSVQNKIIFNIKIWYRIINLLYKKVICKSNLWSPPNTNRTITIHLWNRFTLQLLASRGNQSINKLYCMLNHPLNTFWN